MAKRQEKICFQLWKYCTGFTLNIKENQFPESLTEFFVASYSIYGGSLIKYRSRDLMRLRSIEKDNIDETTYSVAVELHICKGLIEPDVKAWLIQ